MALSTGAPIVDDNAFDIEAYIGNYTSRTRITRLFFIAEQTIGTRKELEALKLAADILKQGIDVYTYREVIEKIAGRLGPSYTLDDSWIDRVENQNRLRQEELISQLHAFTVKSAKEGIRMAHNDLAVFYYDSGRLQDALKEYQKSRDYCATPKQNATVSINALKITLETKTFAHLAAYIRRTETLPRAIKTRVFESKVNCFHGLKELEGKKYHLAANQFIEIHPEIADSFTDVATAQDMASYGALCALASFNRDELKANVLSNVEFKELMEYTPELKECVKDFQKSDYNACLSRLESLKPILRMDMFLGPHLQEIYSLIRQRALIQYTVPFSSISLHLMADAFNLSIQEVEKELVSLIMKDEISARVDSENKILYSRQSEARSKTFQNAKSLTKTFLQDHKGLLIRLSLIKHELIQKQPPSTDRKSKRDDQFGHGKSQVATTEDIMSRLL